MAMAMASSPSERSRSQRSCHVTNDIRLEEKAELRATMSSGKILQVYGPPMVGKLFLIDQAINEIREELKTKNAIRVYPIDCRSVKCFEDILELTMEATKLASKRAPMQPEVLNKIKTLLKRTARCHHIFKFYKCGTFRSLGLDHKFSDFVAGISNFHITEKLKVTSVFTTFVKFPDAKRRFRDIYIGMLTDPLDIECLFGRHAPDASNLLEYAKACRRTWGLPDALIRIAEEFLNLEKNNLPSAEFLEELIVSDPEFVHIVFRERLDEVTTWLNEEELKFAQVCLPTFSRRYTEDFLKEEYLAMNYPHNGRQWDIFLNKLKVKHALLDLPDSDSMAFHPLVVYYCVTGAAHGRLTCLATFTRQGQFLCRILIKAEESINLIGSSSQYYSHWSEIKHLLEKAIHHPKDLDPQGSFDALCKIGLTAGRLIMITFADEAKMFYKDLLNSASVYGSARHRAVLQAHCGHLSALGSGIDWQLAERSLDSALKVLRQEGLTHFYRWTATRMAIVLQRQGKNLESLEYYAVANQRIIRHQFRIVEDCLKVPEFLEQEEKLTRDIYKTIPLIFNGDTQEALDKLFHLHDSMKEELQCHPHYAVLLNNIGLALERRQDFQNALIWYKKSLDVRRPLKKITPNVLVTSLNNIAMLLFHHFREGSLNECESYLKEAFGILEETNWHFGDRALTLNHLAEVNRRKKDYFKAFKFDMDACNILQEKMNNSEFILKVLLDMAHLRVVLRLQRSQLDSSEPSFSEIHLEKSPEDYIQQVVDIGKSRRGNSFDFHNNFLAGCGHGMLLHAGRSRADFEMFKSCFLEHQASVEMDKQIKDAAKRSILNKFNDVYVYIKDTDFSNVDLYRFTECVFKFCAYCRILRKDVDNYNWNRTVQENARSHRIAASGDEGETIDETVRNESESGGSILSVSPVCATGVSSVVNQSISETSDDTGETEKLTLCVLNMSISEIDDTISTGSSDDASEAADVLNPSMKSTDE